MLKYFGCEQSFNGTHGESYAEGECAQCGNIYELIDRASLITVQLGMADVFYRAYRIATNGNSLAGGLSFDLRSTDAIKELVSTAIKELKAGEEYWKTYYPLLIKTLRERNPDADIVMVGAFNLVSDLTLADETIAPLGSLMSAITVSMNNCMRKWQEEYDVLFADISNAETLATEKGWSLLGDFKDNSFAGTHPSQNGYNYITRRILSVLPETETYEGLALDIGTLDKVDFVLVNGVKVNNYTLDGKILIVPCSPLAVNLTIGAENENGKITIRTYQIVRNTDGTYKACRIYGNSDALGIFLRPIHLILRIFNLIREKIAGN
jgi:hypothetical protein